MAPDGAHAKPQGTARTFPSISGRIRHPCRIRAHNPKPAAKTHPIRYVYILRIPQGRSGSAAASATHSQKGTPLAITGKQVRQLRSLAHHLDAIVSIGKQGITPNIVAQTNDLLENKELIKCTVQNTSGMDTSEAAWALADATESEMIQVIGHKFVLYRESSRDDIEKIQLV